jgi:hypothetical protein
MSDRYDTYGWREGDVDVIAEQVARTLFVHLEPRSSLYRGEYYNWRGAGNAHIVLQENFIEEDDGLRTDADFPEHVVLLYASYLPDPWFDRIADIPGTDRLRSQVGSQAPDHA